MMKRLSIEQVIASAFSIIFSCSIILELKNFIKVEWLFLICSIFILFLLLVNERVKVQFSYKLFAKERCNKFVLLFTFLLSFTLSTLGAYLWTNSTEKETNKLNTEILLKEKKINSNYVERIDSLLNLNINSPEFAAVNKDIDYWKTRHCANPTETAMARDKVALLDMKRTALINEWNAKLERKINNLKVLQEQELKILRNSETVKQSNISRAAFIFWLFFILVSISELMIVFIQYQKVTLFTPRERRNLRILADLVANMPEQVRTNMIKYHDFMKTDYDLNTEETLMYNEAIKLIGELTNLQIIDKAGFWIKPDYSTLRNYYARSKHKIN